MLRRLFCFVMLVLAGASVSSQPQQRARLNVLFLIADDLNNDLGTTARFGRRNRQTGGAGRQIRPASQCPLCTEQVLAADADRARRACWPIPTEIHVAAFP